ncbi:MAG: glycosyltransferase [Desulfovibrionaceae bacterium]|nr:glycosyltransferase [Desulfovibrionaceae bacterium]
MYSFDPQWYKERYLSWDTDDAGALAHYKETGSTLGYASCYEEEAAQYAVDVREGCVSDLCNIRAVRKRIQRFVEDPARQIERTTVFFSAVSSQYDSLKIPHVLDPTCDYVLYTDVPEVDCGVWDIRQLPFWNRDAARQTRYVKLHPHFLLAQYSLGIWFDQNVLLRDSLAEERSAFLQSGLPIATFWHPTRRTVQEECAACMSLHKESVATLEAQIRHYAATGWANTRPPCSNVVMYNLKHPKLAGILARWWAELETFSRRDQISFTKAIGKESFYPLARKGISTGNHPHFGVVRHDKKKGIYAGILRSLNFPLKDPSAGRSFLECRAAELEKVRDIPIVVLVCIHNALHSVIPCLESVQRYLRPGLDRLVLVDDGSSDETRLWLETFRIRYPETKLIRNPQALGYSRAVNQTVCNVEAEYCIVLNSDTLVTPNWAEKLVLALVESKGACFVSPLSNAAGAQSLPSIEGQNGNTARNSLPGGYDASAINHLLEMWTVAGFYPRVPLVHGFCLGFRTQAFRELGGFDEQRFPQGYGSEDDLSFRASNAGMDLVLAIHTYVYHEKSQSFSDGEREEAMQKAISTLIECYGFERVKRCMKTMSLHPVLLDLRKRVEVLYTDEL